MTLIAWTVALPRALEPWQDGFDGYFGYGGAAGPDVAEVVTDDGRFQVGCAVRAGMVQVHLRAPSDRWPEHLPEEIGCTVGENQVELRLVATDPLYGPDEARVDPTTGIDARHDQVANFVQTVALATDLPLLPDTSANGRRGLGRWGDLRCFTQAARPGWVWVSWSDATRDGEGRCTLPTRDGDVELPVRVRLIPR